MSTEPIDIRVFLRDMDSSGGIVLRGFRSRDELRDAMQQSIDAGKKCAFVPSLKTLRKFYNTNGFVVVMNEINAHLCDHRVIVEPGVYDSTHVFAVGPRPSP